MLYLLLGKLVDMPVSFLAPFQLLSNLSDPIPGGPGSACPVCPLPFLTSRIPCQGKPVLHGQCVSNPILTPSDTLSPPPLSPL